MYHNQPNLIELHDDVAGVEKAELQAVDGQPVRLTVTYILRPDRQYVADKEADVRLHSTNGVNHRYTPINSPDPALEVAEGAEQPDLNYYAADFNENEDDATRAMRRQQLLVDETTARRRSDGASNANSMTERELAARKKQEKTEEKSAKQEESPKKAYGVEYGDTIKLDRADSK